MKSVGFWACGLGKTVGWSLASLRGRTCGLEDTRVAEAVAGSEGLHHAVDLLGLAGQPEAPQELPGRSGQRAALSWAPGREGLRHTGSTRVGIETCSRTPSLDITTTVAQSTLATEPVGPAVRPRAGACPWLGLHS